MPRKRQTLAERFWPKVDRKGDGECWPWLAAVNKGTGYGQIWDGEKAMVYAHRVAYTLAVGLIPPRMTIDHLCSNRLCMNPAHLRACTTQENTAAAREGRETCRSGHPVAQYRYTSPRGESRCRACNTLRHREYADRRAAIYQATS